MVSVVGVFFMLLVVGCVLRTSDGWLIFVVLHCLSVGYFRLFFLSERSKVKSSTYLDFSIEKILQTFFLSLLVFKLLSCSKNLIHMWRNRYKFGP
jgi:hypothetical protein